MKKLIIMTLVVATALAGCATFGIQNAGYGETREGTDYKLLVNAWDKKATDLGVSFSYRINGGPWLQKPGIFNGSLYEATVPGSELSAGYLEYYASMRNAKGDTVSSKPVVVKILTFAEAKTRAERDYLARLSDGGTEQEFTYDEPAVFRLKAAGPTAPASASCSVRVGSETKVLPAQAVGGGLYEASIPAPHSASAYSYQWTVTWQDPAFGAITSTYPTAPRSALVLDRAAVRAKVQREFGAALAITSKVEGSYFAPPVVVAEFEYSSLAGKYSLGPKSASLILRGPGIAKQIGMAELSPGVFSAAIPADDLERGAVELSILYTDSFKDIGILQAQYPADRAVPIAYKSFTALRNEAIAAARAKLAHQAPADGLEGSPLSLRLDVKAGAPQVISISLDSAGQAAFGKNIAFVRQGDSWYAAVPGAFVRPGSASYRISAVVRDAVFGDLEVQLPDSDSFAIYIKSIKELKAEREAALKKGFTHQVPTNAVQGAPILVSIQSVPGVVADSAKLFYRTAESRGYRESRGQKAGADFTFSIPAAETSTSFFQYFFTVTATDPAAGSISAIIRESAAGGENDFILVPAKAQAQPVK